MKKLATILALTAVVANLGLATVFAANNASQVIGCTAGAVTLDAPLSVSFFARNTNFVDQTDSNVDGSTPQYVTVTDLRGYDPGAGALETCGAGKVVTINSGATDLTKVLADPNMAFKIPLYTGTMSNTDNLTEDDITYPTSSPVTLVGDVVNVTTASNQIALANSGLQIFSATEAFYGVAKLRLNLATTDSTVSDAGVVLKAAHNHLENSTNYSTLATFSPYAGALASGIYNGVVTISMT